MATPPYTPLDPDKPSGPTQAPDVYSASDLANVRALRDAIIIGAMQGWNYSHTSGATNRPTARQWKNGAFMLSMNLTYPGGLTNLPATVAFYWSNDSGVTFSQIGATANLVWDTTLITITSVDTNGGLWVSWLEALMKGILAGEFLNSHMTATGAGVHGLGTMSTQNANAVAITGGTESGVTISSSSVNSSQFGAMGRAYPQTAALTSGAAWDWSTTPPQCTLAAGGSVARITNAQPGEPKRLAVAGGGAITIGSGGGGFTFSWATGHPVWGAAGTLVTLVAVNGTTVVGTTVGY